MEKIVIPTNVDINSCAVCIKSNYYKMGCVNFQPQVGGGNREPMIMETIYERDIRSEPEQR